MATRNAAGSKAIDRRATFRAVHDSALACIPLARPYPSTGAVGARRNHSIDYGIAQPPTGHSAVFAAIGRNDGGTVAFALHPAAGGGRSPARRHRVRHYRARHLATRNRTRRQSERQRHADP